MKRLTHWLTVALCTVLFGAVLAAKANGQDTGERAFFNLTEPLDVGGTILQPGDYQIKVVPLRWNRNLLQVTSADGAKVFATLLSVPHPEGPAGVNVPGSRYIYYPASAGHVKALRTWFAANTPQSGGHDIVYHKQRATELAVLAKEPVVAIPDDVQVAEYKSVPLVVVTPDKEEKPYETVTAETAPAPAPVKVAENDTHHKRLPRTASNVPLYAGLGLLSLIGALALGALARRVA
jgi:hypothetical protein